MNKTLELDHWKELATEIMRQAAEDINCRVPSNCSSRKNGYTCRECWYSAHHYFRSNLFSLTLRFLKANIGAAEFIQTETNIGRFFIGEDK